MLEISDRSGVFEKEEFSSESLDRLIHRFERNGQSRVVADADWIFDDYLVEFRYFDDHKLQFNGNHLFLLCRFAGRRRQDEDRMPSTRAQFEYRTTVQIRYCD